MFPSELNEVLGFRKRIYAAGKPLNEKPTNLTNSDKMQLKCSYVDRLNLRSWLESSFFPIALEYQRVSNFFWRTYIDFAYEGE